MYIDTIIIMGLDVSLNGVHLLLFTTVVPTVTGNRKSMRPLFSISHRRPPGSRIYNDKSFECFTRDPIWWGEMTELLENHVNKCKMR
jgi:hypothetical protein